MPRLLRWTVRVAAAGFLAGLAASVALVLWVDWKVADPALAGDIAARAGRALGANVTIGALDFYWPGRLHGENATIRLDDDPPDAPFAEVATVNLLLAPSSLWTRRLQFRETRIIHPHLSLRRRADGTLALPQAARGQAPSTTGGTGAPMAGFAGRFWITGAEISLANAADHRPWYLGNGDLHGSLHAYPDGMAGGARLGIGEAELANGVEIHRLTAELRLADGIFSIDNLRATVGGAQVRGELSLRPAGHTPRLQFSASAEHIARADLEPLLDFPAYLGFDHGAITLRGGGDPTDPASLTAGGEVTAHNMQLNANQLLESTGLDAAFPGWEAVPLGDTTSRLLYGGGGWHFENLATASPDPSASVTGNITLGTRGRSATHLVWSLPLLGGAAGGTFNHEGDATTLPYTATVAFHGVDLPEFLKPFHIRPSSAPKVHPLDSYLEGRADASLRFTGDLRRPGTTANGTVSVRSLNLAALQLLKDSGVAADLPELRTVRFGNLAGNFSMAGQSTRFENFRSDGTGTARLGFGLTLNPAGPATTELTLDLPVCQGRLQGRFTQKSASGSSRPFALDLKAAAIDAPGLLRAFRVDPTTLQGRVTASFSGTGDSANPALLKGTGTVALRPARLDHVNVFTLLATLLAMPGAGSFQLDSVDSGFHITNRTIHFTQIRSTPETRNHFTGRGSMGFDGAQDFRGTLIINSGAPGFVGNTLYSMGLRASRGMIRVPFTVKGTAGKPRVALDATALSGSTARSIYDNIPLFNRIHGLFGKKTPPSPPDPSSKHEKKKH